MVGREAGGGSGHYWGGAKQKPSCVPCRRRRGITRMRVRPAGSGVGWVCGSDLDAAVVVGTGGER